jgi:hypothetical protein
MQNLGRQQSNKINDNLKRERLGVPYGTARCTLIRSIVSELEEMAQIQNKKICIPSSLEIMALRKLEDICRKYNDPRINKVLKEIDLSREGNGTRVSGTNRTIFYLLSTIKHTKCYRCKQELSAEDLSIDHIQDWFNSENPKEMFFDLENIAFSHLRCNMSARKTSSKVIGKTTGYKGVYTLNRRPGASYASNIRFQGKTIHIGQGEDPVLLARAYDKKAIELFGKDAVTNKSLGLYLNE